MRSIIRFFSPLCCSMRYIVYNCLMMNKNILLPITSSLGIAAALFLSSCAPVNQKTRIEKNPTIYEKLPESHKALVRQGQIKKGMHKDGVFLAWGKPNSVTQGFKSNRSFEKWIYTSSTPVYRHGFNPYFGYGWGSGRRGWGSIYGVGINPGVSYVKRPRATVSFNSYNKVESWEARK